MNEWQLSLEIWSIITVKISSSNILKRPPWSCPQIFLAEPLDGIGQNFTYLPSVLPLINFMSDISEHSSAFCPFFAILFFLSQGLLIRSNVFLIISLCLFISAPYLMFLGVVKTLSIGAQCKFGNGSVRQILHLVLPDDALLGWVVKDDAGVLFILFSAVSRLHPEDGGLHPEDGGARLKVSGLPACVVSQRTAFAHDLDLGLSVKQTPIKRYKPKL